MGAPACTGLVVGRPQLQRLAPHGNALRKGHHEQDDVTWSIIFFARVRCCVVALTGTWVFMCFKLQGYGVLQGKAGVKTGGNQSDRGTGNDTKIEQQTHRQKREITDTTDAQ